MSTTNTNTNTTAAAQPKPSLMDQVEGFFGIKKSAPSSSSSTEPSDNVHVQADAEAQHRAQLVSDLGIPQPVPTAVLADVKSHAGKPEHVKHIDVTKSEHSTVPVGHVVKDPTLLDKMSAALHNITHSSTSTNTTTTAPATTTTVKSTDAIPHSSLPNQVLADVKSHKGTPEHVKHVAAPVEHSTIPLGHVVAEPSLMDKMSAKLHDLTASKPTTTETATSTINTNDAIPHSALPDQVLADVKSHAGKPEHVKHVDVTKSEHSTVPLGHVVKDPTLLDKMSAKLHDITSTTTTAPATTTTVKSVDAIPHSALPNQVLADVKSHKGTPERVHHVAAPVEHSSVPLGHVVADPSLMDKVNAKLQNLTTSHSSASSSSSTSTSTTSTSSIKPNDAIPHSALPNQVLADVKSHKGTPERVKHVAAPVEHSSVPLGHVVKDPTLLDKMSAKLHDMASSTNTTTAPAPATTTTVKSTDAIPHSALSNQVLADVKSHKGTPEHVKHVDLSQVEHSSVPVGHVVAEPTLMDKMSAKLHDLVTSTSTSTAKPSTATTSTDAIPHSALPDQVLADVKSHKGTPEHPKHIDLAQVEHSSIPVGRVVGDVSCLDQATSSAIYVSDQITGTSAPVQHAANIPTASLNSAVMKDIRQQHGQVPNAHHVQVIEHPAVPLGHVVEKTQ